MSRVSRKRKAADSDDVKSGGRRKRTKRRTFATPRTPEDMALVERAAADPKSLYAKDRDAAILAVSVAFSTARVISEDLPRAYIPGLTSSRGVMDMTAIVRDYVGIDEPAPFTLYDGRVRPVEWPMNQPSIRSWAPAILEKQHPDWIETQVVGKTVVALISRTCIFHCNESYGTKTIVPRLKQLNGVRLCSGAAVWFCDTTAADDDDLVRKDAEGRPLVSNIHPLDITNYMEPIDIKDERAILGHRVVDLGTHTIPKHHFDNCDIFGDYHGKGLILGSRNHMLFPYEDETVGNLYVEPNVFPPLVSSAIATATEPTTAKSAASTSTISKSSATSKHATSKSAAKSVAKPAAKSATKPTAAKPAQPSVARVLSTLEQDLLDWVDQRAALKKPTSESKTPTAVVVPVAGSLSPPRVPKVVYSAPSTPSYKVEFKFVHNATTRVLSVNAQFDLPLSTGAVVSLRGVATNTESGYVRPPVESSTSTLCISNVTVNGELRLDVTCVVRDGSGAEIARAQRTRTI